MQWISCALAACAFAMGLSATSAAAVERFETGVETILADGGPEGFLVSVYSSQRRTSASPTAG